jgi:hypothetical protein
MSKEYSLEMGFLNKTEGNRLDELEIIKVKMF